MGHMGMALTFAMPDGLLGLLAGAASGRLLPGVILFAGTFLNRALLSVIAGWGALHDPRSLAYCWLYPLRDLMGFGFWLASHFSGKISWRDEQYRLEVGGKMVKIN